MVEPVTRYGTIKGRPGMTSSRVSGTLPGRPMSVNPESDSTAAMIFNTVSAAAVGLSCEMYASTL